MMKPIGWKEFNTKPHELGIIRINKLQLQDHQIQNLIKIFKSNKI